MSKRYLYKVVPSFLILFSLPLYGYLGRKLIISELVSKVSPIKIEQKGISLGLFNPDPNYNYIKELREVKELGVTHVQLAFTWFLRDIYSSDFYSKVGRSPSLLTLQRTINQAHSLGLKVFLFPIVEVQFAYLPWHWRGVLRPIDKGKWFKNYKKLILQFAEIAEKTKTQLFSVGSELNTMDIYTEEWKDLIKEVKTVYSGKITYSANWDHYSEVKFWEQLDYIGVTGYFELFPSNKDKYMLEDLIHGWREQYIKIMRWQNRWRKPLIITEVGYRSSKNGVRFPWKWGDKEPVSLIDQLLGYISFMRVWHGEDNLKGIYFWNWYGVGGKNCDDYTPKGKPSELAIRYWFKGEQ